MPKRDLSARKTRAKIAQIAIQGYVAPDAGEKVLLSILRRLWPTDLHAKFLLTPGGFIWGAWPDVWKGRLGWESRECDFTAVIPHAEQLLQKVVTEKVYGAASGKADFLTIGVDLGRPDGGHAELIAVVDVALKKIIHWTGKSYPVSFQERRLIHVVDLDSHFRTIARDRVLILGCHDLNMFSPRGRAVQAKGGKRRRRCGAMRRKVKSFAPKIVLHHPHSTDSPRIWAHSWASLRRIAPSIRVWGSGIGYYVKRPRAPLERVLAKTSSGPPGVRSIVVKV